MNYKKMNWNFFFCRQGWFLSLLITFEFINFGAEQEIIFPAFKNDAENLLALLINNEDHDMTLD